jgi:hypothetical protein
MSCPAFEAQWKRSKGTLKLLAEECSDLLLMEFALKLAPFKFKKGRVLKIDYGMKSITLEFAQGRCIYPDGYYRSGIIHHGWNHHAFPIQLALNSILKDLATLDNAEDDVVLEVLHGRSIPLTEEDVEELCPTGYTPPGNGKGPRVHYDCGETTRCGKYIDRLGVHVEFTDVASDVTCLSCLKAMHPNRK